MVEEEAEMTLDEQRNLCACGRIAVRKSDSVFWTARSGKMLMILSSWDLAIKYAVEVAEQWRRNA